MRTPLALIVEGFCEYDTYPSIVSKILGKQYWPISNARGIGNITKNIGAELLKVIKLYNPKKIIVTLDYREALREGLVNTCVELKDLVTEKCKDFIDSQENGSLELPDEIIVIVVDKCYETWLCADYESLKTNPLINGELITEKFTNVDQELDNPGKWIESKVKNDINLKSNAYRKKIAKGIRPEVARDNSRSFKKFYDEIFKLSLN